MVGSYVRWFTLLTPVQLASLGLSIAFLLAIFELFSEPETARQPAMHLSDVQTEAQLGQLRFADPVLSGNYKRSCASCHRPRKGFSDQRPNARTYTFTGNLRLNTPTLLGAARQQLFFHDGRAQNLETVIASVLTNPDELNSHYQQVTERLVSSPTYRGLFQQMYQGDPSEQTINKALIAYLRELAPVPPTDFVLPDSVRGGEQLFVQMACQRCHPAPDYRDGKRHEVAPENWVRTPTLRHLAQTMPYFANGSAPTIETVLQQPFHAHQQPLTDDQTSQSQIARFLRALPTDEKLLATELPTTLPDIPGAPPRRPGGLY